MKMRKNKKTIFNVKPKNYDISYEYLCPKCGLNHWLTNVEAKTYRFKIACECGIIIVPAQIKGVKLKYQLYDTKKNRSKKEVSTTSESSIQHKEEKILPEHIKKQAVQSLCEYGFENKEAEMLIDKAFEDTGIDSTIGLLKQALKSLGVNNASFSETNNI